MLPEELKLEQEIEFLESQLTAKKQKLERLKLKNEFMTCLVEIADVVNRNYFGRLGKFHITVKDNEYLLYGVGRIPIAKLELKEIE